ncbi:MAG: ThiF family adenylyltransferase [Phycisphaeraceae bacterium]
MDLRRYNESFSRNIGWVTQAEQNLLRGKRIALAGLGGVGGSHLLTLTRLGVGAFHIADLDVFEQVNFNRQAGATISTLGKSKVSVLMQMARDINPDVDIRCFNEGVQPNNADEFFQGCDLYVDGIDFFAVDARRLVFRKCEEFRIPAVTAAPVGLGAAMLTFLPGGMTFEQYFRLEGCDRLEQLIRLMAGLTPRLLQASYVADATAVDFDNRRVPSTGIACEICAGMVAAQVMKILLNRGKVKPAPRGVHFDAYRQKLVHTWRPWGNRNPLQRVLLHFLRKRLGKRTLHPDAQPAVKRAAS